MRVGTSVTWVNDEVAADQTFDVEPGEPTPAEAASGNVNVTEVAGGAPADEIDLDAVEADLDGVDAALTRLADGTYWTDEVTGAPIPPEVLDADPLARRA